ILKVTIVPDVEAILVYLEKQIVKTSANEEEKTIMTAAIGDSYKRLIQPSIEREIRSSLTEKAETQAIEVFSENLKNLLLQPPLKGRTILGVDPAVRTGWKLAAIDETGNGLEPRVMIRPTPKRENADA